MKLSRLFSASIAAATLACAGHAQQLYGPWVHDAGLPFSLYVSPTGSNANSGLDPANALLTLDEAVTQADFWQSILWPISPTGVTINVLPGTYVLQQPVSVPAFGVSIEAYWTQTPGTVTISGPLNGQALLDFDHLTGPLTTASIGLPDNFPPSVVRGLTLTNNFNGYGVLIDPTRNAPADLAQVTIAVQVNQCLITNCARAVLIQNQGALEYYYQNVIVDNEIAQCAVSIEAVNAWYESDLFRSNRISDSIYVAMRFNGSFAKDGMMHPRVLSNAIRNVGFLVGVELTDCSARMVNNTIGFVVAPCCNATSSTIGIFPDAGGSSGESIVIANNLLFSPPYFSGPLLANPPEIRIPAATPFTGSLVVQSNDFDSSGALISPALPVGPGNIGIGNPQFAGGAGDVHLTAASPSVSNQGNQSFVVPGAAATILLNGNVLPANCALDMDLDPRTHMQSVLLTDVLHRGADQFIETGARLRTATTGPIPRSIADPFGNLPVNAGGVAQVDLLLDLPVGSAFALVLGAALPMGPEFQQLVISPLGSAAIDPTPGNGATVVSGVTNVNPQPVTFSLGQVAPAFTEAEMYLQGVVALPNGVVTFTNRIRLDVDGI